MSDYSFTPNGELTHYGVKGMKWGIRRYQNSDGSLTSAGRKRQQREVRKAQKKWDRSYKKNYVTAYNKASDYANKKLIPELNKKYKDYDFSDLTDPRVKRVYDKYVNEYEKRFSDLFARNMRDLIGDRPE